MRIIAIYSLLLCATLSNLNAQYTINHYFGDLEECDTMTRGIYIVWWDKDFNYDSAIDVLLDSMIVYRTACLEELNMADPPSTEDGFYQNVYIHTPGNEADFFNPYNWGNGLGTDPNGYPFLTLPNGVLNDWVNNAHETFHIFQYNANSPGFEYSEDSQWYIEATANWFAALRNPDADYTFIEAESLVRVPQVPLWLSFDNFPSNFPENWQRYVHQYALALLPYYLTEEEGIDRRLITKGFFNNTTELPQEYFYNQLGGETFRKYFINWAGRMVNDFDFISAEQRARNELEWSWVADPEDDFEYIETYNNEGTEDWYAPDENSVTHAWSFNTYKLLNNATQIYKFELKADPAGTQGTPAFFQGQLVIKNSSSGTSFYNLDMLNNLEGSLSLSLNPEDYEVYFIIAAMPEVFEDSNPIFQRFPYEMKITPVEITSTDELHTIRTKQEMARFNILGQSIDFNQEGLQFIQFDDGSIQKVFRGN